jgi:hypothetical protein
LATVSELLGLRDITQWIWDQFWSVVVDVPALIPDPVESKFSYALELVNWIWDQFRMIIK